MEAPFLPDPADLTPIELEFWTPQGRPPADASVVVRGAPITAAKFLEHATRQAREYSLRGANMASLSIDLVLPEWPLDRILTEQLATYRRYAATAVATLTEEGFEVLATGQRPHGDVVLPSLSIVEAQRLAELFAPYEQRNVPGRGGDL
jgi:hypothetical protein